MDAAAAAFDTLLVTPAIDLDNDGIAEGFIRTCIADGRDILWTSAVSPAKKQELILLADTTGCSIQFFSSAEFEDGLNGIPQKSEITQPPVPILFVLGDSALCDVEEVAVRVGLLFSRDGFRAQIIAGNELLMPFGVNPLPPSLLTCGKREADKVTAFNRYVNAVFIRSKPDIIIIQIPGGTAKFYSGQNEDYGIYRYIISRAVVPDYAVCCSYFSHAPDVPWGRLEAQLGFPVHGVHLSNAFVCESAPKPGINTNVVYRPIEDVRRALPHESGFPGVYCMTQPGSLEQFYRRLREHM